MLASAPDLSAISDALGTHWEFASNMYKPFACGLVMQAAIDACIQMRAEHGLHFKEIEQVSARVNPIVMELTAKREPRSGLEGKFSIYHACAVALVCGRAGETEFADAAVLDPEIVTLRRKVEAVADPAVAKMEAHVTIRMAGGRRLEKHVPSALGRLERPMSDRDLEAKFHALVENVFPAKQGDQLIAACWGAEHCEDASSISRLCGTIQPI